MENMLREKLLKTREEFLKLEGYEGQVSFLVEVALKFDDNEDIIIVMRNLYESKDGEYVTFGEEETIEVKNNDVDLFIDLLRFAKDRYGTQFSYAIHPFLYYLYGNNMDTGKIEKILKTCEPKSINDKIGFIIRETIF